ncbi:putative pentatricopeptide repeat-containing protein At3g25970 [Malania oleifera]|uniref:putative pentatricopeptide repeat-containing protein At3g25970 n=1 Tax=Malania oleifera TaxID=397392 RepID=UPI0025ADB95E|nr:putative pentatricopeptide repeat-containing protein At3g25970 [Malania oleifera]
MVKMRPLLSLLESWANPLFDVMLSHCQVIKLGTIIDIYTANNIICGYTKRKDLVVARKLFDEMPHKDTVSWNSMISGYVNCGNFETAWEFFKAMQRRGFKVDVYTFGSILKGIACVERLDLGQRVHSIIVKMGHEGNIYAGSALLDMYAKCKRVEDAFMVFQCMPEHNSVSWNALIAGYSQLGDRETAFWLLDSMELEGMRLDNGTFAPLMTLLDDAEFYTTTMRIHAKIVKHGLLSDTTACNATVTSYSECGSLEDAERVFYSMDCAPDLVTWNSMLAAYLLHNQEVLAFKLFLEMEQLGFEPDIYTYTSVISACFDNAHQKQGKSLHGLVLKRGLENLVEISNALITMYLKANGRSMEDAITIFESMQLKDYVSWNSILTGLSQGGLSENVLKLFVNMQTLQQGIDHYAFSAVLRSCSDLATLQLGQQVHVLVLKSGFEANEFVASSLIFMYSKCGIIEDARKSFEAANKDSTVTWNSLIFGYAQHGQGKVALDLFYLMRERKVRLDHITFVAILTACSHSGLIEEGRKFLKSMESDYGIPLHMEHYACGIDLYGRAGHLDEAKALIELMPFEPDAMVWKTLMAACRSCGDIELACKVASHLLELEPKEHSTYVILSSIYSHFRMWDDKASVTRLMRETGVRKVPGWSWIEVKNKVHAFNAEDRSHPHCKEIYWRLEELMEEVKRMDDLDHMDGY